eukprot:scaffold93227_cov63-Phaeocystis_antarctica.AAC.1
MSTKSRMVAVSRPGRRGGAPCDAPCYALCDAPCDALCHARCHARCTIRCTMHDGRCICIYTMHIHGATGRAPPRLAGERKPSMAQKMAMQAMASSCMPVPRLATRQMGKEGGRKTSACTSFQPLSSWVGVKVGLRVGRGNAAVLEAWGAATVCASRWQPCASRRQRPHLSARRCLEVLLVLLVVTVEVATQRAHHDHRDDAREQQHDGERVDDREPVDLVVAHVQVEVPARRPPE